MAVFMGFDGGGTKVAACAIDERGEVIFKGRSGPANWASTPRGELLTHLEEAAHGAPDPAEVAACVAGLLTEGDAAELTAALAARFPRARVRAYPDYVAAWAAYEGPGDPVLVLAGTGSIVVSASADGRLVKSGGRGPLLGDEGSMFAVGKEAIHSVLEDGRSEAWRVAVMGEAQDFDSWIAALYRSSSPAAEVAQIGARALAYGGPESDEVARTVAGRLAELVIDHLRRRYSWVSDTLRSTPWRVPTPSETPGPVTLVLAGGAWDASPSYEAAFRDALVSAARGEQPAAEGCIIDRLRRPPVLGAAHLARQWSL